jgi:hypothetical protein
MKKPKASILDATSGNRMMWRTKASEYILWIDVEEELEVKPDKIMDCTKTDFEDKELNCIFFDPPHWWGDKLGGTVFTVRNDEDRKKLMDRYPKYDLHGSYYGTDKYKTKAQLLRFIFEAQKEFFRILRDDGMLWLRWTEYKIKLHNILGLFRDWNNMLQFQVSSNLQTMGSEGAYWVMLMKKELKYKQQEIQI